MNLLRYVNPFGRDAYQPSVSSVLGHLRRDPGLWFRCAYYRWYGCHSPAYHFDWCNNCGESSPDITSEEREAITALRQMLLLLRASPDEGGDQ